MAAIEPDTRQFIQTTAITAYSKSIGYTPTLATYFQLALQHAWQRNLDKSITALSHALRLNKFHIPSIHLLTLLLTALEDYEKALQTCHTIKFDHLSDLSVDDAIALMEMQLTYLRLVEVVSGRDLALEVQKGVFKLYNKLFGPIIRAGNTGYVKKEMVDIATGVGSSGSLGRGRSNLGDALVGRGSMGTMHQPNDSVDSKTSSLQIPQQKTLQHQRSLLKRRPRSHSADGRSISTTSSVETPERRPDSSYPTCQPSLTFRLFGCESWACAQCS
jgi:tetratricopeptide (TPR) repeat protein